MQDNTVKTRRKLTIGVTQVELDLRGLKCPLPVMRARKALARLTPGAEVTVLATDPMTSVDIPHMCHEDGHALIDADQQDARTLRFHIRCGSGLVKSAGKA